jgi:hypothetical protein
MLADHFRRKWIVREDTLMSDRNVSDGSFLFMERAFFIFSLKDRKYLEGGMRDE